MQCQNKDAGEASGMQDDTNFKHAGSMSRYIGGISLHTMMQNYGKISIIAK